MIKVQRIEAVQTLALRQSVLWPDKQISELILAEDTLGLHYGAVADAGIVAVASVFVDQPNCRLRKFAIDPDFQRQGIGSAMIKHIKTDLKSRGYKTLWCDARETALPFYQSLDFQINGARFFKSDVAYFKAETEL